MRRTLLLIFIASILGVMVAFITGCNTVKGANGENLGLGHVIITTSTSPDGTVTTSTEQIPPTPAELSQWRDFALQTAAQVVAMVQDIKDKEDAGKTPSTEDQIRLALTRAVLASVNNWLVQNGGTAIEIPNMASTG